MKLTTRSVLVNLAWIGMLLGAEALAQQPSPAVAEQEDALKEPAANDQPESPAAESAEESLVSIAGQAESCVTSESVFLDGGTCGACSAGPCCAVCGGGSCCPDDWYLQQDVRMLARGRSRRTLLGGEFASEYFGLYNGAFTLIQVTPDDPDTEDQDESEYTIIDLDPPLRDVLNTRLLTPDVSAGYGATVGHYLGRDTDNRDHFVEFTYWGMNSWLESAKVNGVLRPYYDNAVIYNNEEATEIVNGQLLPLINEYRGSLRSPFTHVHDGAVGDGLFTADDKSLSVAFNNVEEHSISYWSRLDNFELNARLRPRGRRDRLVLHPNGKWRRECQPGDYLSYLFGLRLVSIDERFDFLSRGGLYDANRQLIYDKSGSYVVRTHNDMFGLQIGGDYMHRNCRWAWGVRAKAGPFINFSDQASHVATDAGGDLEATPQLNIRRYAKKDDAALLAEFGFVGTYNIRPNVMLRGAYDFMWVTGLALAPEQLQFETDPPARVNDNGRIFFHGLSLGLEMTW